MASVPASSITAVLGIATTPSLMDRCGGCGRNGAHSNQDDPSVGSGIGAGASDHAEPGTAPEFAAVSADG
jgi:hypothetical protein